MKIRYFSDLHLEFQQESGYWTPPHMPSDADTVLVLAGDIHTKGRAINYANSLSERFRVVVLVAGNHDYWGSTINKVINKWLEEANENVYPLVSSQIMIDDVLFVGGTLWTDFNNRDPFSMWNFPNVMVPDCKKIRYGSSYGKFRADQALHEHEYCVRAIKDGLELGADKTVVVTHHSPSYSQADPRFSGNESEHYYHSNLDDLVCHVDVWITGHTHYNCSLTVGPKNTKLLTNQYGYHDVALADSFDEEALIEI